MIKIALDAMGGDNAPRDVVHGGIEAARVSKGRFEVVLVGDKPQIDAEIERHFHTQNLPLSVVHASESVAMDEKPAVALKKKDSSISVAMNLQKQGKADAVVSAGNTGAVMAAALFILKRLKGIRRPGIGSIFPSETGATLVLDAGANVDSRPEDLFDFAVMGNIFYSHLYNVKEPKVGLLSVGHEAVKGNEVTIKTHALLKNADFNFIGNIEGGDVLRGKAHVVICDGFVGNIILKFAESLHRLFSANLKRLVKKYIFSTIGALLMKPTFDGIRKVFDYQEYGGAPLLGVQGNCIIAHGKSTPRAIMNAILAAHKVVSGNVNERISQKLEEMHAKLENKQDK